MKLRLLVTPTCNRACVGCCNDIWDLDKLPGVTSFEDFEEIMLTGGEPMLYPIRLMSVIANIRQETDVDIFLYTAKSKPAMELLVVLSRIQGLTLSLHEQYDVPAFVKLQKLLQKDWKYFSDKSLRLNVVSHVDITGIDTTGWNVNTITWVEPEACPLPVGEVFARI